MPNTTFPIHTVTDAGGGAFSVDPANGEYQQMVGGGGVAPVVTLQPPANGTSLFHVRLYVQWDTAETWTLAASGGTVHARMRDNALGAQGDPDANAYIDFWTFDGGANWIYAIQNFGA